MDNVASQQEFFPPPLFFPLLLLLLLLMLGYSGGKWHSRPLRPSIHPAIAIHPRGRRTDPGAESGEAIKLCSYSLSLCLKRTFLGRDEVGRRRA